MNRRTCLAAGLAATLASACTTADLEAVSAGLAQGFAEAAYDVDSIAYGYAPAYSSAYPGAYQGPYYAPNGFATYSGWPVTYSYGQYVGPFACTHSGHLYTCDSDGDGFADMYGNSATGSFAASHLRVNDRGEAFTWDSACGCWQRARAYDGPRKGRYKSYKEYDYD